MVRSGSEVRLCGRRWCAIAIGWADVARAERPDAVDGERLPVGVLQKAIEFSRSQIVCSEETARLSVSATSDLPDEQVMAEASEIKRSKSHAPWGVQPIAMFETLQEATRGSINVHKAQARTVGFKRRTFLVEHIGDDYVVADDLHVKRHVGARKLLIHKRIVGRVTVLVIGGVLVEVLLGQVYELKCVVINIHATLRKVCRVQETLAINESAGQASVAGAVGGFDHSHRMSRRRRGPLRYRSRWIPSGSRSINRGEEEQAGFAWGQQEIGWAAVGDGAGRCA